MKASLWALLLLNLSHVSSASANLFEVCTVGTSEKGSNRIEVTLDNHRGKSQMLILATVMRGGSIAFDGVVRLLGKSSPDFTQEYVAVDGLGTRHPEHFFITVGPHQGAKGEYTLNGNVVTGLVCNPIVQP